MERKMRIAHLLIMMRVLHLNTSDTNGGAARAAYRLHSGLRSNGVDSRMLVQNKDSDDNQVYGPEGVKGKIKSKIRRRFDKIPLKRYPDRDPEAFSPAWTPERRAKQIVKHDPDIVHLHWVSGGFIRPETIAQIDVPVVWTLHDMWPFTGGCHYSKSCIKYQTECGSCPHLKSDQSDDLASSVWKRKKKYWGEIDITVVSPSQWLAKQARESSLLGEMQIDVVPNCINVDLFYPRSQTEGIQHFDLDQDRQYIIFGSAYKTHRKGGDLLLEALKNLRGAPEIVALTFGNISIQHQEFPVPVRHLGRLSEDELRLLYSTADLTVIPSREDNLPNIAVESIASGTPCVAFDVGGLADIITHGKNGYLAEPFDIDDLTKGITWAVESPQRKEQLSEQSRRVAEDRFSVKTVIDKYLDIYRSIAPYQE
ncbi:glycosyltransferase family 4 protein [Halopenitus sp. H-Gu1]|uniref:glycosyltransferase family 4 protein n=1 Tax=Halopenitus sp. H-Gu1 TaxID=3242697 RepID=UPI00359D1EAC